MATPSSVQSLIFHGKKYPFCFGLSLLFLAVSFLLFFSSSEFSFFTSPSLALLRQSSSRSPPSSNLHNDLSPPLIPRSPEVRDDPPPLSPPEMELPSFTQPPPFSESEEVVETPPSTIDDVTSESTIASLPPVEEEPKEVDETPPRSPPPIIESPGSDSTISSQPPEKVEPKEVDETPPKASPESDDVRQSTTVTSQPPENAALEEVAETESPVVAPETELRGGATVTPVEDVRIKVRQGEIDYDKEMVGLKWKVCPGGVTAVDYIPCLDNWKAIKALKSRRHMEHRERHCPVPPPRCLVALPKGYKVPIRWPKSRDMIWYDNVPHPKLVDYKKDQHWVVKSGDYFVFPGGGTQFKEGVTHYTEFIEKAIPVVKWGQNIRVVLDVGCGVASFGGHLLDRGVLTMSLAPKDEHEAQIQFALERGIPATLSVIGTQQLTFPDNSFDLIHCARCRVHWEGDGGRPLLELNRVLRPGGFFIWSATPVYRTEGKEVRVWNAMVALTKSMCWEVVAKTMASTGIGLVVYQKPVSSSCYEEREMNDPPMCDTVGRNMSWYSPLQRCIPHLPLEASSWPPIWPKRLTTKPLSLPSTALVEETFKNDTDRWSALVSDIYMNGLGINWSSVRNVMDMTAGHGGFAAALIDLPLWVMNVVPIHRSDTLNIIFDRGLIGVYHDWCESFNTYPRTYDLLHSTFLFSNHPKRCDIIDLAAEIDRIVRPGGWILFQESKEMINKIGAIFHSLQWSVDVYNDQYLVGKKSFWRPRGGQVQR